MPADVVPRPALSPRPSWPRLLLPQHLRVWSSRMAQVWRWPATRCRELAGMLIRQLGARVAVTGSADEDHLAQEVLAGCPSRACVNLCGKLSIRGLAALYARAQVVVSNDSMPIHLAAAVGSRVAAVFGPSKPRETAPFGPANRVIVKPFPCRYTCDESRCRHERYRACLESITAHEVLQTVGGMLA